MREVGGALKVRLPLFPLVRRFRLLPLNHAAAHDAVKAPQVEEGDGAEQSHGDDLRQRRFEFVKLQKCSSFGKSDDAISPGFTC